MELAANKWHDICGSFQMKNANNSKYVKTLNNFLFD